MTIKEVIKKYPSVEIELLLSHLLGKSKEFLLLNPGVSLSASQQAGLSILINRRLTGEPIAYILGYKDFMGLRFKVNKNVLVPRPETEALVDAVIASAAEAISKIQRSPRSSDALGARDDRIKILDVGTGSGCIAVSLAKQVQGSRFKVQITASDLSPAALAVAKQNAKIHKAKVKFIKSDLLKNIKEDFDIIIANLPYGWKAWKNNTTTTTIGLKFEPQGALFTEEKGLKLIRELLEQIAAKKNQPKLIYPAPSKKEVGILPGASYKNQSEFKVSRSQGRCWVYLEFDPRQKADLQKLIKKILPKSKAIFYKDLNNLWRFVEVTV